MNKIIDELSYRSWCYQIYLYGMKKEKARLLFKNWKIYEKRSKGLADPLNQGEKFNEKKG
jgi:hypothetical protein